MTVQPTVREIAELGEVTLAASTVIEPLVANWCAFSFLVSPVTSSLYFRNYQLPLLNSFIAEPDLHEEMAANPRLSGGPFVNIPASRLADVERLRDQSVKTYADNLQFADDLVKFLGEFAPAANGLALAPWYLRVPERLRPFVELVYDYHHRPHVRFNEPLLYRSSIYRRDAQAIRIFTLRRDADRPYFLNTPRIPESDGDEVFIPTPFDTEACETIVNLASAPLPFGAVRERLSLSDRQAASLARHVTPWSERDRTTPSNVFTYLGHASVMIHWKGTTIITDPVVAAKPLGGGEPRLSFDDLPAHIDYVAITHNHHDHFAIETLMRLAPRIGTLLVPRTSGFVYGDVSLKSIAKRCNIRNVVEMETLDSIPFPDGEIVAVPFLGEHSDLAHSKNGYVVRTGAHQAFFGADSDAINEPVYSAVRDAIGPVHTVFIGTEDVGGPLSWTCGPLLPSKPSREQDKSRLSHGCDDKRALRIVELLGARRVFCYAMGLEPWVRHLLGAAMSLESPQLRTARSFVETAQSRGYEARLLHGITSFD